MWLAVVRCNRTWVNWIHNTWLCFVCISSDLCTTVMCAFHCNIKHCFRHLAFTDTQRRQKRNPFCTKHTSNIRLHITVTPFCVIYSKHTSPKNKTTCILNTKWLILSLMRLSFLYSLLLFFSFFFVCPVGINICSVVTNMLICKSHSVSVDTVIRTLNEAHPITFRKLWITFGYEKGSLK